MNKQEFEEKLGRPVSGVDYEIIEYVYQWHPAIRAVGGKDQIVAIYNAGGMTVIRSMQETARIAMNLDKEKRELRQRMDKLEEREKWVMSGNITYELCREEANRVWALSDSLKDYERLLNPLRERFGEEIVERVVNDLDTM